MRARVDDELAVETEDAFAAANGMLDQLRWREVLPQLGGLEFLRNGENVNVPL